METGVPGIDWTFRAMGADWRVHHGGGMTGEDAQAVADAVHADELLWSRFLAGSDVSRITRAAGTAVPVAEATLDIVSAARDWSERTDGRFQPLVGRHLIAWGYRDGPGDGAPPDRLPPHAVPDASGILVSRHEGTVRIPAETALDLGGIGKSWSAVRAGALLAARCDDPRLIIDAGGDLAIVRGTHTVTTAAGPVLAGEGTGVATSSSERRRWRLADGSEAHHLIDPRTGGPAARGTAVVAGVDPVAADVLASCVVIDPAYLADVPAPAARCDAEGTIATGARWREVVAAEPLSAGPQEGRAG